MQRITNRRQFLGAAGSAGLMVAAPGAVRGSQANSAITVGVIGYGNRGSYVSGIFAANDGARVTAVCDIYEDRRSAAIEKFGSAKIYTDAKELLASDVDAVLIATPAFLHPEHFEMAVAARKHIFMEKPAGVNAAGCRRVIAAARKADKAKRIQVDYQQRYGKDYRKAYEMVKAGELGAIKMVRAAWLGNGAPIKPNVPPAEEKMRNWYFYRELSGDILVEQDCHNLDVVNWFTGSHPVKASGYGSQRTRKYGDVFDSVGVTFEFADGLVFSFSASQLRTPGFSDVSETFLCEKGAVNTSRKGYTIYRDKQAPEFVPTKYDITQDSVNEFVEGVRNNQIINAAFDAAESTLVAVMAVDACVRGTEATWEKIQKA